MRIVCISDTHFPTPQITVPDGDVLVHCGDATLSGHLEEIATFAEWFGALPHRRKIFVAGNHDFGFQRQRDEALRLLGPGVIYLEDSGVTIDGIEFWGSPWQPWFLSWAFNLPRGEALKKHWDKIPPTTDVLITHTPPYGILDLVERGEHVGCKDMLKAVKRVRPRFHLFGHIHGGYGMLTRGHTTFVNASICTEYYMPTNAPVVVEL